MLRNIVVLCVCISIAFASYYVGPHQPKPDKFKDATGCYISDLDEVIPLDQGRSSKKECLEYFCNTKSVSYTTCGFVEALPPCKIVEDTDKPYPDCCPKNECPADNSTNPTP